MHILEKFRKVHSDTYDYSKVDFINTTTKVSVICREHGEFSTTPKNHLKGKGCPKCGLLKISAFKSMSYDKFIEKAHELHENKYDYKCNNYKNLSSKIDIICKTCKNEFSTLAKYHLHDKSGCPKCSLIRRTASKRTSFESFIQKCKNVHGDHYQYNKSDYKSLTHKTNIKCKICDTEFVAVARNHVNGYTKCPNCHPVANINKIGHDEFVRRSKLIHGDNYDYSIEKVDILLKRINIQCNKCDNIFSILPHTHIRNLYSNCKKCFPNSVSSEEKQLVQFIKDELLNNDLNYQIIENSRSIIYPKEIDIYIPDRNFAIEYNGLFWHKEDKIPDENYHYNKFKMCHDKNIKLMQIFSDEWKDKQEICKSMIRYRLGIVKNTIHARKCEIKQIDNLQAYEFYENNHISGGVYSKYNIGLFHLGELVSCLSFRSPFTKNHLNSIEISRFCNKLNTNINGSFSKLLKYFIKNINNSNYSKIITYADLRFGTGEIYGQNGFILERRTQMDYWYTDGVSRFHRFKFRKKNNLSEKQNVENCEMIKVNGCGSNFYCLNLKG